MKKHPIDSLRRNYFSFIECLQSVKAPEAILPVPEAKQVEAEKEILRFCTFRT